jgi:predicted homoserine dehydrogenase-like protein
MKMGKGPLYSFYTPYHITFMETPISAARVALCNDVVIAPKGGPVVDVAALAKRDLRAGETLDGIGGYMTYGTCENYTTARQENLLPIGLAEGAVLTRDIRKDEPLTYGDVELPSGSLTATLRARQDALFPAA